jgi:hypothetical protein
MTQSKVRSPKAATRAATPTTHRPGQAQTTFSTYQDAGPGARAMLSLDEARLAHAGPHLPTPLISKAHPGRSSVLHSRLPGV